VSGPAARIAAARLLEAAYGGARAVARRVRLAPSRPLAGHRWTVARRWFTAAEPQRVWLDEMAAVFMRTEPPVDSAYTTATLILDLVDRGRTALINDPGGLRACSEHLLPLRFPGLIRPPSSPPTNAPSGRSSPSTRRPWSSRSMVSPAGACCASTAMTRTWDR
jgi:glutathione synthase